MISLYSGALLFIAAVMTGTGIKNRYKKHYLLLKGLDDLLDHAERGITLSRPIFDIMDGFKGQCTKEFEPVRKQMAERMKKREANAEKLSPLFTEKEKAVIKQFMQIGTVAGVDEVKSVAVLRSAVNQCVTNAENKMQKEGNMYFKLSVIAGVALMILVA